MCGRVTAIRTESAADLLACAVRTRSTDENSTDPYCYIDSCNSVAHGGSPAEEKEHLGRSDSAGEHSGGYKHAVQSCPIRFDCAQTRNALGPTRRSQILRNRHEHGGRQDIGRFLCNRAGPTNKSNYPRTGGISSAAELPNDNDAVSGAQRAS